MPVEEQTTHTSVIWLNATYGPNAGQRLTIANRKVTKLGFWLYKEGNPTGDVILRILKVSDDTEIVAKKWGLAEDLTTTPTYREVTFDTPATINEEVRILAYHYIGAGLNNVGVRYANSDVKASEYLTRKEPGSWEDFTSWDCAYRYTYEVSQPGAPRQQMATFLRR